MFKNKKNSSDDVNKIVDQETLDTSSHRYYEFTKYRTTPFVINPKSNPQASSFSKFEISHMETGMRDWDAF